MGVRAPLTIAMSVACAIKRNLLYEESDGAGQTLNFTILPAWREERRLLARSLFAPWFFLALSGEFLPAFFGMNENVIGVAQFLIARVPDFAKTVQVVRFDAVQNFQHVFIDFRLQLLRECLVQPGKFRPEDAGPLQFAAGVHDPRKRKIQAIKDAIDF